MLLLSKCPKDPIPYSTCLAIFTGALFLVARNWSNLNVLHPTKMDNENVIHTHHRKNSDVQSWMAFPGLCFLLSVGVTGSHTSFLSLSPVLFFLLRNGIMLCVSGNLCPCLTFHSSVAVYWLRPFQMFTLIFREHTSFWEAFKYNEPFKTCIYTSACKNI